MSNNNSNYDFLSDILMALAIGGFIWAITERNQKQQLQQQLYYSEKNYYKLMEEYLKDKKEIPKEIKKQLLQLRMQYMGIDQEIADKLQVVIELIQENKESIAIEKLTTIIENLLKNKFKEEQGLSKNTSLYNLLKKAKESNWITDYQYNFALFLKKMRNTEAHELKANYNNNEQYIGFLTGIEIIYQLAGFRITKL